MRVVISTPGATISEGVSYSNTTSLRQTSSAVLARTRALARDPGRAARAVDEHFRLRSIRFGPSRVWPNAPAEFNKIANHSKLGMVDNCAIGVGSHNLYPFWLSEYTLMSEDRRVAGTFKSEYADEIRRHSARSGPLPGRACARNT